MADYGYSQPFTGFQQGLPQGYLQAATMPGQNIARGIESAGASIGAALEKYRARKDEGDFAEQKIQNAISTAYSAIQQGSVMDPKTHESQLLKSIMGITKAKDEEKLINFASEIPGMPLGKKKALAHDLEFALQRYDTNRTKDAEIAYREAVTQQLQEQLRQQTAGITTEGNINQIPLQTKRMVEVSNPDQQVSVYDESGNLQAGPGTNLTDKPAWDIQRKEVVEDKPMSQLVSEAAAEAAKNRVPFDAQKAIETFMARGAKPEAPQGMIATGATQKTPGGGAIQYENLDAKTMAEMAVAQAKARNTPMTEFQSKAMSYARDMNYNESIIKNLDKQGYDGTGITDQAWKWSPDFIKPENRRDYEAAKEGWSDGLIRSRTGAVASKQELAMYDKDYFPQPNDGPGVIANKKKRREIAMESMRMQAGQIGASMIEDGKKRFKWNPVTKQLE